MGRPTKYGEHCLPVAEAMAQLGATDEEIAKALDIAICNFKKWKLKHAEFQAALKKGKAVADAKVQLSLYKRAVGFKYNEHKTVSESNGYVKEEVTEKTVVPDVTAQIFWLKNRMPARWRDVKAQEVSGPDGKPVELSGPDGKPLMGSPVMIYLPDNGRGDRVEGEKKKEKGKTDAD